MNQLETVGSERIFEKFNLPDGSLVSCEIFDTGGAVRLRKTNEFFYKKVDGFIVVFDITNKNTFDDIRDYFLPKIRENSKDDIPILIIGNKKDLKYLREVSIDEADELAFQYNCTYKEASCLEYYNLNEIFEDIIEDVKSYIEANHINHIDTISLGIQNDNDSNLNIGNNNRRNICKSCC